MQILKIFLAFVFFSGVETPIKPERIKIAEYGYTFIPPKPRCILSGKLEDDRNIKIKLQNLRGEMDVECYTKDSLLVEKGHYVNSLALLSSYSYFINGTTLKGHVEVVKYYQPLRDGEWMFYNKMGKIYCKKKYNKGILVDSVRSIK